MSPLPPDPYKILGVPRDAQIPEIRSAHRKLVLKCHPDKVQDPTLKGQKQDEFQKVQQAYELLSDDKERQKYDDQVKLAELRKQMQNKANQSVPRATPKYAGEFEIRTAEPRSSSYKSTGPSPSKAYATYSRSWEEDTSHGPRIFEAEIRTRREGSYNEKYSKKEVEREREREREREMRDRAERDREYRDRERERERERESREREREKEKERRRRDEAAAEREREKEKEKDRRRRADDAKRAEKEAKEAKEARRAEKKAREKQRDKDLKREMEEKKRHKTPYVEAFEDELPKSEKKKSSSSSKKHDDKRERSSHREEAPQAPVPPVPQAPEHYDVNMEYAASYIASTRAKSGTGAQRTVAYHLRNQPPAVPTPPPAAGQSSPFPTPDDDEVRRSSARTRRGSSDTIRSNRDKAYKKSSREVLDDQIPEDMAGSPSTRHAAHFSKSAASSPMMASSPPRHSVPRQNSMPVDPSYTRPIPGMSRSHTFNGFSETADPRGRSRSRMQSQIDEIDEYESEEEIDDRHRDRKSRSSRKKESAEPRMENVRRYQVDGGRTKAHGSYTRTVDPELEYAANRYYAHGNVPVVEHARTRPSMAPRDGSYGSYGPSGAFKVKTSKAYGTDDVQYSTYSHYQQPPTMYREDNSAFA